MQGEATSHAVWCCLPLLKEHSLLQQTTLPSPAVHCTFTGIDPFAAHSHAATTEPIHLRTCRGANAETKLSRTLSGGTRSGPLCNSYACAVEHAAGGQSRQFQGIPTFSGDFGGITPLGPLPAALDPFLGLHESGPCGSTSRSLAGRPCYRTTRVWGLNADHA